MSEENIIHIKNMVCPRCIMAVENVFAELKIEVKKVELGQVTLVHPIVDSQKNELGTKLKPLGFELLESGKSQLISRIKDLIIQQLHYYKEPLKVNFSTYLADELHHDYSYLSRLFSSTEGITIEKFITTLKIEKVKEFLFYDEMTLSEIAFHLNYSSVAHLSSQFKKETGMTPTAFKSQRKPAHQSIAGKGSKS